jgi:sarcosine oxidase subunit delta
MKLLNCPLYGPRPIAEFVFGGEFRTMPDPDTCSDIDWSNYVYHRKGAPQIKKEWWYHSPTGTWFLAERNTLTDEVLTTYLVSEMQGTQHE